LAAKEKELAKLNQQLNQPGFWEDRKRAQKISQQAERLKEQITKWQTLDRGIKDLGELADLAEAEDDQAVARDVEEKLQSLQAEFDQSEIEVILGDKQDVSNAILTIHAGTGGTEAQDWAEMLLRMYLRYVEQKGWRANILDKVTGNEAGIKSVTLSIAGNYAYGHLKAEVGTHRLVRLSPFDADHARHTSFALVEATPEVEDDVIIEIQPSDLKIDTFRSSGAGGQHVNVTDSAVRITHEPSGLVVSCQNERSQLQNKESALRVLKSKLYEQEIQKQREREAETKGEYKEAKWGNQIRSYVLHPYQMVKDHRTKYEEKDTAAVLDGQLDKFIESYLRQYARK